MIVKYVDEKGQELRHSGGLGYNPYRDGKTGRFTFGPNRYVETVTYRRKYDENTGRKLNEDDPGYGETWTNTRYTPAGIRRLEYEKSTNNARSHKNKYDEETVRDTNRWVRDDWDNISNVAGSISDAGRAVSKMIDSPLFKTKPNKRLDLSDMTNDEIRAIVDRERLERSYNELFNTKQESKGKEYAKGAAEFIVTSGEMAKTGLEIAKIIRSFRAS